MSNYYLETVFKYGASITFFVIGLSLVAVAIGIWGGWIK